jgi:predicted Zn finger-like uncharacterized protein
MKIACQSCQAKYTIADEKVLGRVVKIRCKKCGATIVINGNDSAEAGGAAHEEATQAMPNSRAFDYAAQAGEEPWTVNVADGDQRTLSTADLVAQFKAGVVNDETYCWRDGMGDWLPLREIEPLSAACGLGMGGGAPQEAPQYSPPQQSAYSAAAPVGMSAGVGMGGGGGGAMGAGMGGGGLGALFGGGDPGAYAAAPQTDSNGNGALHSAPAAARRAGGRAGGVDLFGTAAEAGGENDVMTSAPQGTPAMHEADSKLTGQRNENSVLFSLNALTQNAPKEDLPGPQGDGSGLIDIRALSANMAPSTKKQNHVDDIMNLGGGGAFSAALAAPVLAPPSSEAADGYGASPEGGKSNKMMFVLMGIGALIVALLLVVVFRPKGDTVVASGTSPTATGATPAGQTPPGAATDTTAAPTPPPPATDTTPAAAAPAGGGTAPVDPTKATGGSTGTSGSSPGSSTGSGSTSHKNSGSSGGGGGAAVAVTPPPSPPPAKGSFDDALKQAGGGGGGPAPAAGGGGSTSPFDRGAAAGALGAVNVGSCKRPDGPTGSGHVAVTFAPDGSVSTAVVDQPPFAGTPVGGCVAGKFRSAHIPGFSGGPVKVGKSFAIN